MYLYIYYNMNNQIEKTKSFLNLLGKQEIIGYTSGGEPVSKGQSSSPWMAWVPELTTLNNKGQAYQPYGPAGIPYTMDGGSLTKWTPSGAGSDQALAYLDSAPGAQARKMYQERTCSPLWSNVFGCSPPCSGCTGRGPG